MFKPDRELDAGDPFSLTYPYFMKEPVAWESGLDYYSGTKYGDEIVYWYHHTLSNIMQSVIDSGFTIQEFSEFEHDDGVGYDEMAKQPVRPPMSLVLRSSRS
jgi:hypothetical protein